MSYAFQFSETTGFSRGEFLGVPLSMFTADEASGLGTTDPVVIARMESAYGFQTGPNGEIDWNRDGIINSSQPVKAALAMALQGCAQTAFQHTRESGTRNETAAMAWGSNSVGGRRLYLLSKDINTGIPNYRFAQPLPPACGSGTGMNCTANWSLPFNVPFAGSSSRALAVTAFVRVFGGDYPNAPGLVLVYVDQNKRLAFQLLKLPSLFSPWQEEWSRPAFVGSGLEYIEGDPAVVNFDGRVLAYGVSGFASQARLLEWELQPDGVWTGPVIQHFAGGKPVIPIHGVGVTSGYVRTGGNPVRVLAAAIPSHTTDDSETGIVDLAWKDDVGGEWHLVPRDDDHYPLGRFQSTVRPGIAYVPIDPDGAETEGRFFLALNRSLTTNPPMLLYSVGNDVDSSRAMALRFPYIAYYWDEWHHSRGNVELLYDSHYDRNLRGAMALHEWSGSGFGVPRLEFSPAVDGVLDVEVRDQDDLSVILSNLRCSLGRSPACI